MGFSRQEVGWVEEARDGEGTAGCASFRPTSWARAARPRAARGRRQAAVSTSKNRAARPRPAKSTVMGITFSTQNCAQAGSQSPRPLPHMNLNVTERLISSELRGAGFNLQEVIPPELESAARLGRRTRGAGLRQLEGVGRKRFVLSSDDDNELRSRCE